MAAFDSFEQFNSSLSKQEREVAGDLIKMRMAEFLAARSEDARMRLLQSYLEEVHEILREARKQRPGTRTPAGQSQHI